MPLFGPPDIEKLKAKRDIEGLIKALSYRGDAKIRKKAIDAMRTFKDIRFMEPFIACLKDNDYSVKTDAQWALVDLSKDMVFHEQVIERMITILKDDYGGGIRKQAANILEETGDVRTIEPMIACLKDPDFFVRCSAERALTKFEDVRAIEPLIALLKKDPLSNVGARDALISLSDKYSAHITERIITCLEDPDKTMRWRAAEMLGKLWIYDAIEPLITCLKDPDPYVKNRAAIVLRMLEDSRAVSAIRSYEETEARAREAVCDVCSRAIDFSEGYALTTNQVVTEKKYWLFIIRKFGSTMNKETLNLYVQQQAMQRSGWLVCESCSDLFLFARKTGRECASGRTNPRASYIPVVADIARVASEAWKEIYDEWPNLPTELSL